ncbi:MAG: hypothetical protein H6640_18315 [Caldilineaceae bacterium]|nr:hypothetical protein [Caldilineaceae bacterium]
MSMGNGTKREFIGKPGDDEGPLHTRLRNSVIFPVSVAHNNVHGHSTRIDGTFLQSSDRTETVSLAGWIDKALTIVKPLTKPLNSSRKSFGTMTLRQV